MRQVYICGEHIDQSNVTGDGFRLFDDLSALLRTTFGEKFPAPGTQDIIIRGEDLVLLKAGLMHELAQRVNNMEEKENANTSIEFMGRSIRLNTRDHAHSTIYTFDSLASVADKEYEKRGGIFLYNISALDSLNTYIMKVFRQAEEGMTISQALEKFRAKYTQFTDLDDAAFAGRVETLLAEGFLMKTSSGSGEALFRCSGKSLALKII